MTQRAALPIGVVWLMTVISVWAVATALLVVMARPGLGHAPTARLISQSTISATFASVVVGGPATAVALRVRRTCGRGRAALSGLATATLIMLFAWSYLAASGAATAGTWRAIGPVFVIAVGEIALSFGLRGRRPDDAAQSGDPPQ